MSLFSSSTLYAQVDQFQKYDKDYSQTLSYDELLNFYQDNQSSISSKLESLQKNIQHHKPAFFYSITKKKALKSINIQEIELAQMALCLKNPYCKKTQLVINVSRAEFDSFNEQLD